MESVELIKQTMDTFNIIAQVEQFYTSAWDKLILVAAVLGIWVPLLIQFYQKKLYDSNEKKLSDTIKQEVKDAKTTLEQYLKELINEQDKNIKEKVEKLEAKMEWMAFHLQAVNNFSTKDLGSCIIASKRYLECEDFKNLRTILKLLILSLEDKTREEVEDLKIENKDMDIVELIDFLKKKNYKWSFSDQIADIEKKFNKLPKTRQIEKATKK